MIQKVCSRLDKLENSQKRSGRDTDSISDLIRAAVPKVEIPTAKNPKQVSN